MPSPSGLPSHCGRSVGGISGGALASLKRHSYSSQPRSNSPRSSERLGDPEMRPGKIGRRARWRALAAGDRLVEFEAVVMQDAEIVVAVDVLGASDAARRPADQRLVERPSTR